MNTDLKIMQNAVAQTLQSCIQLLGPMPDEIGNKVKDTLGSLHPFKFISLDMALNKSIENKSYQPLQDWNKRCP